MVVKAYYAEQAICLTSHVVLFLITLDTWRLIRGQREGSEDGENEASHQQPSIPGSPNNQQRGLRQPKQSFQVRVRSGTRADKRGIVSSDLLLERD